MPNDDNDSQVPRTLSVLHASFDVPTSETFSAPGDNKQKIARNDISTQWRSESQKNTIT